LLINYRTISSNYDDKGVIHMEFTAHVTLVKSQQETNHDLKNRKAFQLIAQALSILNETESGDVDADALDFLKEVQA